MELRDYLRVVRRRWMLIVVVTALAAICASLYVMTRPEKYASSSTLFVSTSASDTTGTNAAYQGGLYSQARVQSYVDMVNGTGLAQQVVDTLHLDMSAGQLSSEVSATNKPNTVLLTVTVTDRDPNLALQINQAVVSQLEATIAQIETPPGATLPLIKVSVIDPARFSSTPVSPKVTTDIGLGILVGLLLGLGLAVAREILDSSVKDLRDVRGLGEVPVIASLPLDSSVSSQPLISGLDRQSPRAEAFRVLRTNLQFLSVDSDSKVYVVSSSVPGEGKSTTVTNLAIALAQAGKNVLLVDSDLRRPRVAALLGLVSNVGLTTALVGDLPVADCIQVHADSGLKVLTAGKVPPNPAELLQTQAMMDVLAELREQFDVILVDAPPLLPVTDAALLGNEADGVLLMVRHSKTSKDQLQGAVHRLESVDAHLAGVIFNMVPRRSAGIGAGYAYGYGYGYGYASAAEPNKKGRRRRSDKKADVEDFRAKAIAMTEPAVAEAESSQDEQSESAIQYDLAWQDTATAGTASAEEIAERDQQAAALEARERENAEYLQHEFAQHQGGRFEPLPDEEPPTASPDPSAETSIPETSTPETSTNGRWTSLRGDAPGSRRRGRPTR